MADALTELINQVNQNSNPNFDSGLNTAIRQIMLQAADLDQQLATGQGKINSDYGQEQYIGQRDLGRALDTLGQNTADRGMLRSGIYLTDQAQTSQTFQDQLADAARRRALGLADLEQGYKSGRTGLQGELMGQEQSAADRGAQARYQAQQDAAEAAYRQSQLDIAGQGRADQAAYYQQQGDLQRAANQQQADYYNSQIGALQPSVNGQGQSQYPINQDKGNSRAYIAGQYYPNGQTANR